MDDEARVRDVLERHGDFLRRLVSRRSKDPEAVLQDLWVALLEDGGRRLGNWDPARPLRPYLAAIALNLCRKHRAREARRPRMVPADPEGMAGKASDPSDRVLAREALESLPVRERLAWILVEGDGWSYADAGRLLGIGPGGVGALLTRIRNKLKNS